MNGHSNGDAAWHREQQAKAGHVPPKRIPLPGDAPPIIGARPDTQFGKLFVDPAEAPQVTEEYVKVNLDKTMFEAPIDAATKAPDLLERAERIMRSRAVVYDKPEGERSMGRTVLAFNAITGRDLTESEGWLLLQILKDVRDRQRTPHRDSLEDCIAYAALKAEARLAERAL